MILDTNALSAFAGGEVAVREAIANHAGPYLPVIVLGEYRFGLMQLPDHASRMAWLQALTQQWTVLEITSETTISYAEIRRALKTNATPIPSNDTWIAALARQHGLPILTNDPHFDAVSGIERVSW